MCGGLCELRQKCRGGVNPSEGTGEEETVSENDLDGEAGIALMAADEGVEALAVGDEFEDENGFRYRIINDSQVSVIGHRNGAVQNGGSVTHGTLTGRLVIPEQVVKQGVTYTVTIIGTKSFYWCDKLTGVDIPESVTIIGEEAFKGCNGFTSIEIPGSVTGIGAEAFSWCRLSKVELPEGVTVIGNKAFEHCTSLSKVDLPSSIKIIGERAFSQCALLTSVVIPDGVKSIEDGVFYGCTALNSVTIPDSVTSIGKFAFWKCGGLTSIEIPGNVVRIGENAFQGCVGLTGIEIPKSVTSIESFAFEECTGLTSVEIPENVTSIEMGIFFDCSGLTSVKIPESVTSIGNRPFSGCGKLAGIEIPKNVTSIGWEAFMNCSSLTYVEIPEKVTSIENWTFYGCSSLTKVIISDTVTDIKAKGFYGCAQLKELRIVVSSDGKVQFPKVGEQAFADLPNERYIIFVDKNGKELKGGAYNNAKAAFIEAAKSDNDPDSDPDDGKWYGWSLKEPLGAEDTYRISVNAYKDNQPWNTDCDRIFALTKDNGTTFITNFDAVEAGTYTIYDVTGLNADEFQTKGVNTGVTVPVVDADVSATVDYYTASFYDIDAGGNEVEYGTDTDQRQQTVLKTVERVTRPATNPSKAGHTFDKWVTSPNGDVEFDFATTPVTAPTKIYAKWTKNTAPTYTVTINVKKDKNPWSGHGKTFALLGGGGSGFLEVPSQTGDSTYSLSQVPDGTYRIFDITGVPADSLYSRARDTGMDVRVSGADTQVDVTVNGADEEKDVHYYTATFYDGADAYKAGTPQEPQIVLQGRQVLKPADPGKANYDFAGWKTTDGGSTPYDFANAVTDTTRIFASWVEKTAEQLHITASAAEEGTISPTGDISVTKGGEQTFTITPNEGHKIKAVTVDGRDVTAELKDTLARAQAGARYYTFTNVTEDHTIHAAFETDGGTPGGNDKPADGDGPDGGDTSGGGDNPVPGGGEGGTGDIQTTAVIQTAPPQTVTGTAGNAQTSGGAEQGTEKAAPNEKEPKTGDPTPVEIYATAAMIAGLTYLLLYFMEEGRGMTEREKEVFVAAFIRWAKKGGRFRKCCAIAAIFCLLVYYHGIGKHVGKGGVDREYLRQAM